MKYMYVLFFLLMKHSQLVIVIRRNSRIEEECERISNFLAIIGSRDMCSWQDICRIQSLAAFDLETPLN